MATMTLHLDGKHRPSRKPHLLRYGFATFVAEVEQGVQLILKYNIFVCVIANWRPTSVVSVGRCSCSWACPDCNNFNFTNSFFEDSEIQTENPFDPLNGNNHNSNETTTSSNNTTNNKKTYKQNNRPNFRCILINCQSIKNKATDIEVLNNLHNPDIISATESWLDPSVKNGEIFSEHFNVFRKDRETSTTGGGYSKYPKLISSQLI